MKKRVLIFCILILLLFVSCRKQTSENEITVYSYNSFDSKWIESFEQETGIKVNLVKCAGAVQLYSKLILEGSKCLADAVVGLPDSISMDTSMFASWEPGCNQDLITHPSDKLIPFDYGIYSFIFNTADTSVSRPESLKELADPEYKDKLIIIDPRTSAVGLGLLKWSEAALGEEFETWWQAVLGNSLTVADSWSTAYGLFTEGEAPLVISYTTSPVYHRLYENTDKYVALEFNEGHIETVEYLAIMEKSTKKDLTKQFCEYLLTKGQKDIALYNTMMPANKKTILPDVYNDLIKPNIIDSEVNIENLQRIWEEIAVR